MRACSCSVAIKTLSAAIFLSSYSLVITSLFVYDSLSLHSFCFLNSLLLSDKSQLCGKLICLLFSNPVVFCLSREFISSKLSNYACLCFFGSNSSFNSKACEFSILSNQCLFRSNFLCLRSSYFFNSLLISNLSLFVDNCM